MTGTASISITAAVIAVVYLVMFAGERLRPLRRRVEPGLRRIARNFATGGISLAVVTLLQAPLLTPVSRWVMEEQFGVLNWLTLDRPWRTILGIVLLDYTLWWWHWATHVVPFLWRFHLVHHVDLDLDASTALRFHFGELALSAGYRALQIVILGIDPYSLWLWQTILFGSILFHHGNLRLPQKLEGFLVRIIVTPRMHGIHHSARKGETNSNWSSLLTLWDMLHRTFRFDVTQESITIGVPAYRSASDVTIGKILVLPFRKQRPDWLTGSSND